MRTALLALALVACAHAPPAPPRPWTVTGGTVEEQEIALGLVAAAQRLYPRSRLAQGSEIHIAPDIDRCCGYTLPEPDGVLHYAGCMGARICVLWPHPRLPGADFTRSALAHELGHVVALGPYSEDQADAAALLIVQEYRKGVQ